MIENSTLLFKSKKLKKLWSWKIERLPDENTVSSIPQLLKNKHFYLMYSYHEMITSWYLP